MNFTNQQWSVLFSNIASITGGGVSCYQSSPLLTNCTIVANNANDHGGGVRCGDASSPIINSTIIAFSEGSRPIIIDQPEDSLDNPSVYEDVVSKLRAGKEKRQFILTTHNSSVGVASDSDNFIILESTATQGDIKCVGAIDRSKVRLEIIKHLEGGQKPYKLKSKKYNVE